VVMVSLDAAAHYTFVLRKKLMYALRRDSLERVLMVEAAKKGSASSLVALRNTLSKIVLRCRRCKAAGMPGPRLVWGRAWLKCAIQACRTNSRCRSLNGMRESRYSRRGVPPKRSQIGIRLWGAYRCGQHSHAPWRTPPLSSPVEKALSRL
jgi:hypothetical protein